MFHRKKALDSSHQRTDFGRIFGWWLCLNGERIADLNYWRFDVDSQFWHEYRLFPFNSKFNAIGVDPDRWCCDDISLESRYVEGYYVKDFIMSPRDENLIAIRNASIPEGVFLSVANNGI